MLLVLAAPAAVFGASRATRQQSDPSQKALDARVPAEVRSVIVEQLGVKPADVTWDSHFVDDLGIDSIHTVELVFALEKKFRIQILDDECEAMIRVGHLVEYLRKRGVLK